MKSSKFRPEILAPAGDLERLKWAFLYGADACYIGGRDFSLRANAKNFSIEEIEEACKYAHERNKKVYVTVNIVFHNEDFNNVKEYLKELERIKIDAVIISEVFLIDIIKEVAPKLDIFISTQLSTLNVESVKYLENLGVKRIVLGRELSKEEIEEISNKTNVELEVFIHGAMCYAYSGRCVLSNYLTKRDSNRGGCSQVCRFNFKMDEIDSDVEFTMAPKDLSLIKYIKDIIDLKITSLKIEGRMRSLYYIATVVNTYKNAIDDYLDGTLSEEKLLNYEKILMACSNRDNAPQFFNKFPTHHEQYYLGREEKSNQDFLGIVTHYDEYNKEVHLIVKNYFKKGDIVEFFSPNDETIKFKIPLMYDLDGSEIDVARHPEETLKFKIDKKLEKNTIMRRPII